MTTSTEDVTRWTKEIQLKDGTKALLRPELTTDLEMLWEMYSTLGEESRRFQPEISRELVERWIENLDYEKGLPIVAVVKEPSSRERIIAVATLGPFLRNETTRHLTEFGITVHDDYQDKGLGTQLTQHTIDIAREKGLKKVFLKVFTNNERAIHVYKKCGFKIEGKLEKEHYKDGEYGDDYRMAILL